MRYLLDTNIIIDHIRGRYKIQKEMVKEGIATSIISYGELLYGIEKSVNKIKSLEVIDKLFKSLSIQIIDLDIDTLKIYAQTKASLEMKGKKLYDFDILIAASALHNSYILVTRNTKHFKRIPDLKITS